MGQDFRYFQTAQVGSSILKWDGPILAFFLSKFSAPILTQIRLSIWFHFAFPQLLLRRASSANELSFRSLIRRGTMGKLLIFGVAEPYSYSWSWHVLELRFRLTVCRLCRHPSMWICNSFACTKLWCQSRLCCVGVAKTRAARKHAVLIFQNLLWIGAMTQEPPELWYYMILNYMIITWYYVMSVMSSQFWQGEECGWSHLQTHWLLPCKAVRIFWIWAVWSS
jgi:hypothetical protein